MTEPQLYIQHPNNVDIEFFPQSSVSSESDCLPLGLICNQDTEYPLGTVLSVSHPQLSEELKIEAVVVWCRRQKNGYQIGLGFRTEEDLYRVRMLEQLCHIQLYQKEMRSEGRKLSQENAAKEWIAQYAAHFPADGL